MNLDNMLKIQFIWDRRCSILLELPHTAQVKFALFCANQVKHMTTDTRSLDALLVVQAFLDGRASKEECRAASNAAAAAAYAAHTAAYHAADAAYAAAANAAYHAADAAYHAAYHAADAAYAAYHAADAAYAAAAAYAAVAYAAADTLNSETIKEEQMNYLRTLILESLSEEEKSNWLLVASL